MTFTHVQSTQRVLLVKAGVSYAEPDWSKTEWVGLSPGQSQDEHPGESTNKESEVDSSPSMIVRGERKQCEQNAEIKPPV